MNISHVVLYEDIGVYRLLTKLHHEDLQNYVSHYLGTLLDYDKETNNNLLLTLSTYLGTMGSKKETSEQLYIVRQTLYHRLSKIQELLGEDYLYAAHRQVLELAILTHALLKAGFR